MHTTFKQYLTENTKRFTKEDVLLVLAGHIEGGPFFTNEWNNLVSEVVADMLQHQSYYNKLFNRNIFYNGVAYRTIGVPFKILKNAPTTQQLLTQLHKFDQQNPERTFFSWTRDERLKWGIYNRDTHFGIMVEGEIRGVDLPEIFLFESANLNIKRRNLSFNVQMVIDFLASDEDEYIKFMVRHENVQSEDEIIASKNVPLSIHTFIVKLPNTKEHHFQHDEFKELLNFIKQN